MFILRPTPEAQAQLARLEKENPKKAKKVKKALGYLQANPRHQSLATHEYESLSKALKVKVLVAYVENDTPAAYRIFWHYGPGANEITIYSITSHP